MDEAVYTYDVLIVGAGNAANSAALAALDKNARVGILEKAPLEERGGNSMLTGHMRFAYHGVEDLRPIARDMSDKELYALLEKLPHRTEDEIWDECMEITDNQSDPDLLQVHVTESLRTMHWLCDKGHKYAPVTTIAADNILVMNGGGYGLQQHNFALLDKGGARVHYETAATELLQDKRGAVTGVRALTPSGYAVFNAKAVVLACGSFEANPEMRARYLGPGWDLVRNRGVPFNTGDGLRMALDIGAMPYGSWSTCHASPQDLNMPKFGMPSLIPTGSQGTHSRYLYPFSIMVNINGERFMDEASDTRGKTYAKTGRAILAQPGGVAFQLIDARIRRSIGEHGIFTPNYDKPKVARVKANTLEKLAQEFGINAANLENTVRTFNAAVQPGNYSPNFLRLDGKHTAGIHPPKSNYAQAIEEPPFEAWAVRCGMTFAFGGLKIDPKTGEVQHVAGRKIPGLYAAGEMVGGLWVGNYASGSGMMAGATFGRISGGNAAMFAAGA